MADVVDLNKKRRKLKRRLVSVCWGNAEVMKETEHVAVKPATIDMGEGLLIIDHGDDHMRCYPIGSVFFWEEKPHPEDDDVG